MEYINKIEIQGTIGKGIHVSKSDDKYYANVPVLTQETYVVDGQAVCDPTWHRVDIVSSNDIPKVIFESLDYGVTINVKGKLKMRRYENGDGISSIWPYIIASKVEIIK